MSYMYFNILSLIFVNDNIICGWEGCVVYGRGQVEMGGGDITIHLFISEDNTEYKNQTTCNNYPLEHWTWLYHFSNVLL